MTETIHALSQETVAATPVIYFETGVGSKIGKDESVEVDYDNLAKVFSHFPAIDTTKVRVRVVSFFDKEYGISKPDEEGISTITIGLGDGSRALSDALSEHSDYLSDLPVHNHVTGVFNEVGNIADDIVDHSRYTHAVALGAAPGLFLGKIVGEIARSSSPGERRKRAMAKATRHIPPISVQKRR